METNTEITIRIWVRNTILKVLEEKIADKDTNANQVIKLINLKLIEDFKKIATDECQKLFAQIDELVKEEESRK